MEEMTAICQLIAQGYVDVEHLGYIIVAKKDDNGKYYLFDSKDLKQIEGSESDNIIIIDRSTIYLQQGESFDTIYSRIGNSTKESVKAIFNLRKQGYVYIEYYDYIILAKGKDNGKYYLFDSKDLNQIRIVDKSTIFLLQNRSLKTVTISNNDFNGIDDWA